MLLLTRDQAIHARQAHIGYRPASTLVDPGAAANVLPMRGVSAALPPNLSLRGVRYR